MKQLSVFSASTRNTRVTQISVYSLFSICCVYKKNTRRHQVMSSSCVCSSRFRRYRRPCTSLFGHGNVYCAVTFYNTSSVCRSDQLNWVMFHFASAQRTRWRETWRCGKHHSNKTVYLSFMVIITAVSSLGLSCTESIFFDPHFTASDSVMINILFFPSTSKLKL